MWSDPAAREVAVTLVPRSTAVNPVPISPGYLPLAMYSPLPSCPRKLLPQHLCAKTKQQNKTNQSNGENSSGRFERFCSDSGQVEGRPCGGQGKR